MQTLENIKRILEVTNIKSGRLDAVSDEIPLGETRHVILGDSTECTNDISEHISDASILKALSAKGISKLLPIQSKVLPILMKRNSVLSTSPYFGDVCVWSPTGTGKTLCYVLPIIQSLRASAAPPGLVAIVVVPTQELVNQVAELFNAFESSVGRKVASQTFLSPCNSAFVRWAPVAPVLVMTHSGLVDAIFESQTSVPARAHMRKLLQRLNFLILDEFDRLVDETSLLSGVDVWDAVLDVTGVNLGLYKIVCSASPTLHPAKLRCLRLRNPLFIKSEVSLSSHSNPKANVEHSYYSLMDLSFPKRVAALSSILMSMSAQASGASSASGFKCIVFCNTADTLDRLFLVLRALADAGKLSAVVTAGEQIGKYGGVLSTKENLRSGVLDDFRTGGIRVLCATDILSRGIDIPDLSTVINFDYARHAKGYLHRAGRLARGSTEGKFSCVTIVPEDARRKLLAGYLRTYAPEKLKLDKLASKVSSRDVSQVSSGLYGKNRKRQNKKSPPNLSKSGPIRPS